MLAAALAVFTLYVSLLPFRTRSIPFDSALSEFWTTLTTPFSQRLSRSNFLANVLLFVPFGYALMGALLVDRGRALVLRISAVPVVIILTLTVSLTAEFLQVFTPRRVPSALDVAAQVLGALIGVLCWAIAGNGITRWLRTALTARPDDRLAQVLTAYAAAWVFVNLAPFDITIDFGNLADRYRSGRIVVVPFTSGMAPTRLAWDALAATVSAVPLGFFGRVFGEKPGVRREAGAALALGALFIVLVEVAQIFIRSHAADVTDVLFGCVGVAAGVLAVRVTLSSAAAPALRRSAFSGRALTILVLWCAVLCAYHWQPYDFTVDSDAIRAKLTRMSLLPFSGYRASDLNAFNDVLVKLGLSMPFGVIARFVRPGGRSAVLVAAWLILAGFVFGAVELGQFLLPTRVPDPTDVLLGVAGAAVGLRVGMWVSPAARGLTSAEAGAERPPLR